MKAPIGKIMDTDVYTCPVTATLGDVVKILVEKEVGGLTVVDEEQHVAGFISDGDIMRAVSKQKTRSIYGGDSVMVVYDDESFEQKVEAFKERNVMELAARKVFCVTESHPIDEVARILSKKKFKKIPIIDEEGKLVGIARRATIVRYIFNLLFDLKLDKDTKEPVK